MNDGSTGCLEKTVLISTYWNVNSKKIKLQIEQAGVLISTYWNVNSLEVASISTLLLVLISTYWNVNMIVKNSI